jgi:hypothetical protein
MVVTKELASCSVAASVNHDAPDNICAELQQGRKKQVK